MFRAEDIESLKSKMHDYQDKINKITYENSEIKPETIQNIYKSILEFIKKKDRVIYGGWAQNALIIDKNPDDAFYTQHNMGDVEFYSPEPVRDLMEICEFLHEKSFKYVQGREAQHEGTYKLFVEFINVSDITYMHKTLSNNLPVKIIDGIKYIHPIVIAIDFYRMFTNPMTALRLWEKTIGRSIVLFKNYSLTKDIKFPNFKSKLNQKTLNEILLFTRKNLIHDSKLIVIGFLAYNYFVKKVNMDDNIINEPYYEVISINYKSDRDNIYHKLKKQFGNKIKYDEHYPFFQFTGKKSIYKYEGETVLILYDYNEICTENIFWIIFLSTNVHVN
jgi:hypothetical protein